MLDALLAARRVFYVSWTGRNVRDNTEQPPSVLVAQLRDYLQAAWGPQVLAERTTEHPLQPFSARYFQGEVGLFTHAREWREAQGIAMRGTPLCSWDWRIIHLKQIPPHSLTVLLRHLLCPNNTAAFIL